MINFINKIKVFFITLFSSIFLVSIFFLVSSCKNTSSDKENGGYIDSYISTYERNLLTQKFEIVHTPFPFCAGNIKTLCRNSSNATDRYTVYLSSSNEVDKKTINSPIVVGLSLGTDWDQLKYAPDYFLKWFFLWHQYDLDELILPSSLTQVGNDFCYEIFKQNRYTMTTIPKKFNLSMKGLKIAGDNFCYQMFNNITTLENISNNFCLPLNIVNVGDNFCYKMFYNCISLDSLPQNFNLPQELKMVGDNFAYSMFENCYSLVNVGNELSLPQFLIQDLNKTLQNFCYQMFFDCNNLKTLPKKFNFSQNLYFKNITNAYFYMFAHCNSLQFGNNGSDTYITIPTLFNYSISILSNYCIRTFFDCKVLNNNGIPLSPPQNLKISIARN